MVQDEASGRVLPGIPGTAPTGLLLPEGTNPLVPYDQFKNALIADILPLVEASYSARTEEHLKILHCIYETHGGKQLRDFDGFPVPASLMRTTEAQALDNTCSEVNKDGVDFQAEYIWQRMQHFLKT